MSGRRIQLKLKNVVLLQCAVNKQWLAMAMRLHRTGVKVMLVSRGDTCGSRAGSSSPRKRAPVHVQPTYIGRVGRCSGTAFHRQFACASVR